MMAPVTKATLSRMGLLKVEDLSVMTVHLKKAKSALVILVIQNLISVVNVVAQNANARMRSTVFKKRLLLLTKKSKTLITTLAILVKQLEPLDALLILITTSYFRFWLKYVLIPDNQ